MIYQTVCTTKSEAANFKLERVRRKGKSRPVSFHLIDLRIHHYHHHHRRRQRCRRRRCLPLTSSKRRNSENSIYFDIDRKRFLTINSAIAATLLISVLINCSNDTIVNLMR
ncbi:hypothetical protein T4B_14020 [Trichinella pseudospiralis]|uniref:Uncharacterized protein n=1 Tax=Trichinella pseudospiralis TaxID=6337 RepID=A0A0V1IEK4_TRIPS|nr:hypothetical protein T4A_9497 [Trichinella pseudospiralis]KRZ21225.1 hypothetical protein T4B_14020 [Trichinella pseudospiralis]